MTRSSKKKIHSPTKTNRKIETCDCCYKVPSKSSSLCCDSQHKIQQCLECEKYVCAKKCLAQDLCHVCLIRKKYTNEEGLQSLTEENLRKLLQKLHFDKPKVNQWDKKQLIDQILERCHFENLGQTNQSSKPSTSGGEHSKDVRRRSGNDSTSLDSLQEQKGQQLTHPVFADGSHTTIHGTVASREVTDDDTLKVERSSISTSPQYRSSEISRDQVKVEEQKTSTTLEGPQVTLQSRKRSNEMQNLTTVETKQTLGQSSSGKDYERQESTTNSTKQMTTGQVVSIKRDSNTTSPFKDDSSKMKPENVSQKKLQQLPDDKKNLVSMDRNVTPGQVKKTVEGTEEVNEKCPPLQFNNSDQVNVNISDVEGTNISTIGKPDIIGVSFREMTRETKDKGLAFVHPEEPENSENENLNNDIQMLVKNNPATTTESGKAASNITTPSEHVQATEDLKLSKDGKEMTIRELKVFLQQRGVPVIAGEERYNLLNDVLRIQEEERNIQQGPSEMISGVKVSTEQTKQANHHQYQQKDIDPDQLLDSETSSKCQQQQQQLDEGLTQDFQKDQNNAKSINNHDNVPSKQDKETPVPDHPQMNKLREESLEKQMNLPNELNLDTVSQTLTDPEQTKDIENSKQEERNLEDLSTGVTSAATTDKEQIKQTNDQHDQQQNAAPDQLLDFEIPSQHQHQSDEEPVQYFTEDQDISDSKAESLSTYTCDSVPYMHSKKVPVFEPQIDSKEEEEDLENQMAVSMELKSETTNASLDNNPHQSQNGGKNLEINGNSKRAPKSAREMTVRELKAFLQERGIQVVAGEEKPTLLNAVLQIESEERKKQQKSARMASAPSTARDEKSNENYKHNGEIKLDSSIKQINSNDVRNFDETDSKTTSPLISEESISSNNSQAAAALQMEFTKSTTETEGKDERHSKTDANKKHSPVIRKRKQMEDENDPKDRHSKNLKVSNVEEIKPHQERDLRQVNSLSDIESESELEQLSIKQLKAILQKHSVKIDSFSEKSDLVSMIKKLFRDINKRKSGEIAPDDLCRICMSDFIDCALIPCGHSSTCTTCGRKIQECPVCRQYMESVIRLFRVEDNTENVRVDCMICDKASINSALIPCGHMATCYDCAWKTTHCPCCREYVVKPQRVYKT